MDHKLIFESLDVHGMRTIILILRLVTLTIMVALLTMHMRSLRVFRLEHTISGGVLVTFTIAVLGLALCAGSDHHGTNGVAFQAYLCGTGAVLLAMNAAALYRRWRRAGELTRVVAEFLVALGVPLKRQLMIKICLSAAAAIALLIDLALTPLIVYGVK